MFWQTAFEQARVIEADGKVASCVSRLKNPFPAKSDSICKTVRDQAKKDFHSTN